MCGVTSASCVKATPSGEVQEGEAGRITPPPLPDQRAKTGESRRGLMISKTTGRGTWQLQV